MLKALEKHPILSVCILVAIMLLPNLETISVSIMEARNFITAREMIVDNNWLLTTMNGEARYQKPPLPTWLAAISSLIFGIKSIFGLRLPAAIMVMLMGSFMYKLSYQILKKNRHSFINALIVISAFYVIAIIIEAPWDIFTHGFMLVAIYHLFLLFKSEKNYWKHSLFAGIFIGSSFMCKGPVSMYALLLPFLIAYGFTFKFSNFKTKAFSYFSVLLLALIIGSWWFIYVRMEDPATFEAITKKETGNWSSYNVRPFYYYWSFFTQSGLWTIPAFISLLYPYLKHRVSNKKAYTFSFLWTIIAVVLLSVIPEKKSRYLMPVLIPLAINIGFYMEYLFRKFKHLKNKKETIPVYFNFGLIGCIGIVFPIVAYLFLKDNLAGYWFWYLLASLILVPLGILILIHLKRKNIQQVFMYTVLFFTSITLTVSPLSKALISSNYTPISNLKKEASATNLNVYSFNYVSPEMIWQFGSKIPNIKQAENTYNFPKENTFGMLTNGISPEDQAKLNTIYTIEKISTYDLNTAALGSSSHNGRLSCNYYVLTKKE
ncbi:glycosyltransferase family 39 protein [Oceanihabitans sp. 2_MG-2023]|uniref:ArnT family glycosyltransferase n=1 Tax=Oceanihabitans sp. 2_MG-2023 TaxID=3062661 RepID=UPI0026E45AB4|nr:glycosyltransferase family 39 protein [Oceanihabitans sp. 2_MG-2023]MDO6597650.1 glycosyltransferase family 39 protein [Oceanihabitans sp. 2_MG-2023]